MTDKNIDLDSTIEEDEEIQENSVEEATAADPAADEDKATNTVFKDSKGTGVRAASNATKTAKKRSAKGGAKDNTKKDPMPKLAAEEHESQADFSEDLNALIAEEATLSEGFKEKAGVIFEAAINSKLSEEIDRIEDQYKSELIEEIEQTKAGLVEKVDNYLNYVVENWMKENKLAIQSGLRAEIAEGFMNNLKGLFEESYIEVPESKVDLVDDLADQVAELEEQLNNTTEQAMEQANELEDLKRNNIVREASGDLAETQVEKLEELAKDIDFVDEDTFSTKVKTIKESYFKNKSNNASPDTMDGVDDSTSTTPVAATGSMSTYIEAIRKTKDK